MFVVVAKKKHDNNQNALQLCVQECVEFNIFLARAHIIQNKPQNNFNKCK